MNTSVELDKISPALVAVQEEMVAIKDASNPFFKSKYAPLDEIQKSIRPTLKANGLTVVQSVDTEGAILQTKDERGKVSEKGLSICTTRIIHESGQWIESTLALYADKATPQGFGSAATYARRYGICAALSIATPNEDDDGNKAESATQKRKDAEAKQKVADDKTAKLDAHKAKVSEKLRVYAPEIIAEVFENSGYTSEHTEIVDLIEDLVAQVNSIAKLNTIGSAIKEGQEHLNEKV